MSIASDAPLRTSTSKHGKKRIAPAKAMPRPCQHNEWDNVRIKKGTHSLRCRVCQHQWKVGHASISRCSAFAQSSCRLGSSCRFVHIHQFKESLRQRSARFGEAVLENVPSKVLEGHGIANPASLESSTEASCDSLSASSASRYCETGGDASLLSMCTSAAEAQDVPQLLCFEEDDDDDNEGVKQLTEEVWS